MKDFSKATPRPWQRNDRGYIRSSEEVPICRLFSDAYFKNYEANAELIVTAVNNFDDLSKFLKMVNDCLNDGIPIEKDDPIHNIAKKLLESLK